jgi:hypothetical protein
MRQSEAAPAHTICDGKTPFSLLHGGGIRPSPEGPLSNVFNQMLFPYVLFNYPHKNITQKINLHQYFIPYISIG